jgi:hypothetical protein
VCSHVVSGSILSLAFDLCRVCPCCLWLYIVPCLRPVSCVPMLYLVLYCPLPSTCVVCVHVVSDSVLSLAFDLCRVFPCCLWLFQGTIQNQRQHGNTRHRSKARDNIEPDTTWTHTTQVEGKGQYRARHNMDTHDTGRRQGTI